jgi:hypothetical protein
MAMGWHGEAWCATPFSKEPKGSVLGEVLFSSALVYFLLGAYRASLQCLFFLLGKEELFFLCLRT